MNKRSVHQEELAKSYQKTTTKGRSQALLMSWLLATLQDPVLSEMFGSTAELKYIKQIDVVSMSARLRSTLILVANQYHGSAEFDHTSSSPRVHVSSLNLIASMEVSSSAVPLSSNLTTASAAKFSGPMETTAPSTKQNKLPHRSHTHFFRADRALLRLNRLCSTTAGLDSLLGTVNYACYLLAYCQAQTEFIKHGAQFLDHFSKRTAVTAEWMAPPRSPPATASSTLSSLAALLTETRTTLRLAALLPLYGQLRSLLSSSATATSSDSVDRLLALVSWVFYILYQATENIAHLADHRLFLPTLTSVLSTDYIIAETPGISPLWYFSNRLWFLGVAIDLLRAMRRASIVYQESHISSSERAKGNHAHIEQARTAKQVRSDLVVASCWLPLTLNWSLRDGLRGVNDGVIAVLGLLGNWEVCRNNWGAIVAEEIGAVASRDNEGELVVGKEKGE